MKAIIIGGGIGGLTLANAFQQSNIHFELYEAAPQFGEVGAGILLGANAMQVYKALGLEKKICANGQILEAANITDEYGCKISGMPLKVLEAEYNVPTVIIHRASLIQVLKKQLNLEVLHLGKKALNLIDEAKRPIISFEDGSTCSGDFVVGADGIHSPLRQQVFPQRQKRYLGQTCWRAVLDFQLPKEYHKKLTERWGKTGRFAFVALNNHQIYWYAVQKAPKNQLDDKERLITSLKEAFANFDGPVDAILENTDPVNIIRSDIYDLKPQKGWFKDRILFLGDAIHATSPNLGQGGAQAIEDAHALAHFINKKDDLAKAFQAYEAYRYPKAKFVVEQSKLFGELAHKNQVWFRLLRNVLLRSIPQKLFLKQMEKIYKIKPELLNT